MPRSLMLARQYRDLAEYTKRELGVDNLKLHQAIEIDGVGESREGTRLILGRVLLELDACRWLHSIADFLEMDADGP